MQLLEPLKGSQSRPDVLAAEFKSFQIPASKPEPEVSQRDQHSPLSSRQASSPADTPAEQKPNHKPWQKPQNHPVSSSEVRRVNPLPELEAALGEQGGILLRRSVTFRKVVQRKIKKEGGKSAIIF